MQIFVEISARRTGKTTRLLDAAKNKLFAGEGAIIVVPNSTMKKYLAPQTAALCVTISQLFDKKTKKRIGELYNPNFFFDEFDFMGERYPILGGGYYATTPSFVREYSLDICDKLLQLVNLSKDIVAFTANTMPEGFGISAAEKFGRFRS